MHCATALTIGVGVVSLAPPVASAADANLTPGQSANFPTWFWGRTTICAHNLASVHAANVEFSAFGSPFEAWGLTPGQLLCVTRSWVGFAVNVENISSQPATLEVYNVGGP